MTLVIRQYLEQSILKLVLIISCFFQNHKVVFECTALFINYTYIPASNSIDPCFTVPDFLVYCNNNMISIVVCVHPHILKVL